MSQTLTERRLEQRTVRLLDKLEGRIRTALKLQELAGMEYTALYVVEYQEVRTYSDCDTPEPIGRSTATVLAGDDAQVAVDKVRRAVLDQEHEDEVDGETIKSKTTGFLLESVRLVSEVDFA